MILASLALTTSTNLAVVTSAQVVLAALIVVASIHVSRRLHDAVPSTIRSGVASAAGSISWIAFLPIALVFGVVSHEHGVHAAGWTLTALTVLTAALLARSTLHRQRHTAAGGASADRVPASTVDSL